MNKKVVKVINALLIIMTIISVSTSAFAITPNDIKASQNVDAGTITDVGAKIVGILQTVGVVLSVVVLIVLGIRYMMGSTEEKSEYKKTFIPYIVGAALIFAASVFANAIYGFFAGM